MAKHVHIYRGLYGITDVNGRQGTLMVCECGDWYEEWGEGDEINNPHPPKDPKQPDEPAKPS